MNKIWFVLAAALLGLLMAPTDCNPPRHDYYNYNYWEKP